MPRGMDFKYCRVSWDWGVLGLSPTLNECTQDFSSPCSPSSLESFKELNSNHGKTDAFADWMDEKIDLSILDELEGQPGILDDLDLMNGDPAALLDNSIDWSILENGNGTSEAKKNDLSEENLLQVAGLSPPVSPVNKVPDISFAVLPEFRQESLYQKTSNASLALPITAIPDVKFEEIEVIIPDKFENNSVKLEASTPDSELDHFSSNTPPFTPPSSVTSANECSVVDYSSETSDLDSCISSTPPLTPVPVVLRGECSGTEGMEVEIVPAKTSQPFSSFGLNSSIGEENGNNESQELSDASSSGCNSGNTSLLMKSKTNMKSKHQTKKYRSSKKVVPVLNSLVPVEVRRKERKRVQNKDAATRYREKKRKECKAVMDEELALEMRNKELHDKVNRLSSEISYLKGLLNEAKLRAQSRQKMSSNFTSPVAIVV